MSEAHFTAPDGVDPDVLRDHLRSTWPACDLVVRGSGRWTVFGLSDSEAGEAADVARAWLDEQGHGDPDQEFRQAVEKATSVADLKAALLGGNGSPGAEPRRGRPE